MRSVRPGPAIVAAAAIGVLFVAGCTSSATTSPDGTTRSPPAVTSTSTSDQSLTRPTRPSTSTPPRAPGSVLACGNDIDSHASTAPLPVVLGVVALPVSPASPALVTARTGEGNGRQRLFAKTGLIIRPGTTFELVVPAAFSNRLSIGWGGEPSIPGNRVVVSNCPSPGGGWLAYPGGYWVDHPACVPLIVKVGDKEQRVHIGVGTTCPGQRPPQGRSES